MKVLFLAYANRREQLLHSLQEEEDTVYRYLTPRALKQHYLLHLDPFATLSKIAEYLVLYRDDIMLFNYSGHAGRDQLILEDQAVRAEGIAHLLGQCPNLKLVVLNGCSTQGQVEELLERGVPVVVATNAPVEDERSARFAIRFYQGLSEHLSINEAFEMAIGEVKAKFHDEAFEYHRSLQLKGDREDPLWGHLLPAGAGSNFAGETPGICDKRYPGSLHTQPKISRDPLESLRGL